MIKVLPRQQLLGQWRELKLITKQWIEDGKVNHILVNKVHNYSYNHLCLYAILIYNEMCRRNYQPNIEVLYYITSKMNNLYFDIDIKDIFKDWHNEEYLEICYFNLKEKYICGGISYIEWRKIANIYKELI